MTHDELVDRAEKWLRGTAGCQVTFNDGMRAAINEQPDAIGWRNGRSILIECKVSRGDFLADHKKPFRQNPEQGMGAHRLFMCPPGLICEHELPTGWGLMYAHAKEVERVVCPKGNIGWSYPTFLERNRDAEITLLLSALRRIDRRGLLGSVYESLDAQYQRVEADG